MLNSKRGESLIEVMVSLSIIALIFAGAVNMVVGSVTLNLSSRQRLQSIATVQKKLNTWLADNSSNNSCPVSRPLNNGIINTSVEPSGSNCNSLGVSDTVPTCYWLELSALDPTEKTPLGQTDDDFIKVTSHGMWYTRIIGSTSFEVSEIIRKK